MTEKELEQQSEEFKKGFSEGYEDGKQNERKLQIGKSNLLRDVERLEKENEQLKIKIKALESANKAMVKEIDDMSNGGIDVLIKIAKLKEENEQVKKTAIVWHKVTCFDEPDENDYVTAGNPAEEGKDYLVLLKNKRIAISGLAYEDDGYFFEDFDWEDIEAWAELPEV